MYLKNNFFRIVFENEIERELILKDNEKISADF